MLGEPLKPYSGYDPTIFPNVEHFFSAVAMRFAHSNVVDTIILPHGGSLSIKDNM